MRKINNYHGDTEEHGEKSQFRAAIAHEAGFARSGGIMLFFSVSLFVTSDGSSCQ